jgi:hypothetical protein
MDRDAVLIHQVHPLKIGADVTASMVSNVLLWRHRLAPAMAVRLGLPIAGSAVVLSSADMDRLRGSAAGRYVLAHMPPSAVIVRLTGDVIMAAGAWRRSWRMVGLGALTVAAGWSHGLWGPDVRSGCCDERDATS